MARKTASLAVLGVLLCGSLASAQTLGKPIPTPVAPKGKVVPALHTSTPGESSMIKLADAPFPPGASDLGFQQTTLQPRGPEGEDSSDFEFELELPSKERLYGRLESEKSLRLRLTAKEIERGKQRPVFPDEPILTKEKYYGRQWPQQNLPVEPNYVCYNRLYFEQKNFERYGWDLGVLAPVLQTGIFWKDVVLLPYHIGTDPFRCYECSAGYCLPGDPVPLLLYPEEISAPGSVAEVATILTLIAIFP